MDYLLGLFDSIVDDLRKLQGRVSRLELVAVDFGPAEIMDATHREYVLLAAESIGGDVAIPPSLASGGTLWLLTGTQSNGWRLAVPEGEIFNHTAMRFMLIPVFMSAEDMKMPGLDKLPYLELIVDGAIAEKSQADIRKLYVAAMAILHSLLPDDV